MNKLLSVIIKKIKSIKILIEFEDNTSINLILDKTEDINNFVNSFEEEQINITPTHPPFITPYPETPFPNPYVPYRPWEPYYDEIWCSNASTNESKPH